MSFSNSILAGTKLVRTAIQSPNFVTGVSGWSINKDGSAEFLNLEIRGEFSTGSPGTPRIVITDGSFAPFPSVPRILMYSDDPQETRPAIIANYENTGESRLEIYTSEDGFGNNQLLGVTPQSGNSGGWFFGTTFAGAEIGRVSLNSNMMLTLNNVNIASLSSTDTAMTIGNEANSNMVFDPVSIQTRNNGAATDLFLNFDGGRVILGSFVADTQLLIQNDIEVALATNTQGLQIGGASGFNLAVSFDVIQGRNNGAASDLYLNYYGGNVYCGVDLITTGDIVALGMSAAENLDSTGGATASTSMVVVGGNLTVTIPTSGRILVLVSGISSSSGATAGALLSFRIRQTNAAGAIIYNPGDNGCFRNFGANVNGGTAQRLVFQLAAGTVAYIEVVGRSTSGASTATFDNLVLTAIPLP